MNTSEKIDQIATSLFAMRKELKQPTADQEADAGSYKYPYLSLPALIEFIDAKGSALSLSYTQEVTRDGDGVGVTTRLMHSSGQWIELGPLFLPVKGNAQAWGSAISYGRRYALAAAFGIAPRGEDDDAASASSPARAVTSEPSGSGRGGADGGEGPTDRADGEAALTTGPEPPTSTPSAQPAGHHEHQWKPSPTMPGWRWCDVKGCGKAEKIRAAARPVEEVKAP